MPNHKSCEKRLRQDVKRRSQNNYVRSTLKTLAKKMRSNISLQEKEALLITAYSQFDKAAKKGVIHKKTASRRKSRIALYYNSQATSKETENNG
ncbi:MAG: 30S ribosomal protein S20 [Candidatus Cloacimonetes bacterium]|nr:30S ribosomal protein S20 [Candidatus Cloacimonadota bacterium]